MSGAMKRKHLLAYMRCAEVFAECSTATRLKVGAVLVKDDRILSVGYNGTAPGASNDCETVLSDGSTVTRPDVIHAEQNAIYKAARDGQSLLGATMFVTHAPCIECSKGVLAAGIKRVYYRHAYRSSDGPDFLKSLYVDVEELRIEDA